MTSRPADVHVVGAFSPSHARMTSSPAAIRMRKDALAFVQTTQDGDVLTGSAFDRQWRLGQAVAVYWITLYPLGYSNIRLLSVLPAVTLLVVVAWLLRRVHADAADRSEKPFSSSVELQPQTVQGPEQTLQQDDSLKGNAMPQLLLNVSADHCHHAQVLLQRLLHHLNLLIGLTGAGGQVRINLTPMWFAAYFLLSYVVIAVGLVVHALVYPLSPGPLVLGSLTGCGREMTSDMLFACVVRKAFTFPFWAVFIIGLFVWATTCWSLKDSVKNAVLTREQLLMTRFPALAPELLSTQRQDRIDIICARDSSLSQQRWHCVTAGFVSVVCCVFPGLYNIYQFTAGNHYSVGCSVLYALTLPIAMVSIYLLQYNLYNAYSLYSTCEWRMKRISKRLQCTISEQEWLSWWAYRNFYVCLLNPITYSLCSWMVGTILVIEVLAALFLTISVVSVGPRSLAATDSGVLFAVQLVFCTVILFIILNKAVEVYSEQQQHVQLLLESLLYYSSGGHVLQDECDDEEMKVTAPAYASSSAAASPVWAVARAHDAALTINTSEEAATFLGADASSRLSESELKRNVAFIRDCIKYIQQHDTFPSVFGITVDSKVRTAFAGYLVTAGATILGKLSQDTSA